MSTSVTEASDAGSAGGDAGPEPEPIAESSSDAERDDQFSIRTDLPVALDLGRLEAWIAQAAAELPCVVRRAAFELVDDARMSALHMRHMNIDGTTDVLTFPSESVVSEGRRGGDLVEIPPIDVDIAICIDEAARQACTRGHDVELEILLYAVHGLLHCAGFDDRVESDAAVMHAEEDRILDVIGVGSVFGRTVREEDA